MKKFLIWLSHRAGNQGVNAPTITGSGVNPLHMLPGIVLLLVCLLVFAPIYPVMPKPGLDASWQLAMDQAVAQGLVFGRDMIFTFGPYAAVYTMAYHPTTYPWALSLGLLFGLCYGAMLLMNFREHGNNGWLWLYAGFLLIVNSRDSLFFSYPLLVALTACKTTLHHKDSIGLVFTSRMQFNYAFAIALLGVLPIIKGSFLPLSAAAALAGFILFWLKGERVYATLFILLPMLAMIVFWHIAGQPISALPDFFRAMSPIISGYSEAMSKDTHIWEIAAYILVAVLILASILRDRDNSTVQKIVVALCVGLFLFIAFKAGFVRHDKHALAAGSSLVLSIMLLNTLSIVRIPLLILALSIFVFVLVGTSLKETSLHSVRGAISGDLAGKRLQAAFTQGLEKVNAEFPIPRMDGTTDIYPYDQAEFIASGNHWVPRPVPQSYSAYTPALAMLNEAHLRGDRAPDNIVFRVATIDERYPSLDDGLSWPTLVSHYAISTTDQRYAYLTKRKVPLELRRTVVMKGSYKLGKQVVLPQSGHVLFAEIDVVPTLPGRIAQIIFKPPPLYISVVLADGQINSYRFIPSMARAGFVISPLIETTSDFIYMANGQIQLLAKNKIKSIRIAPAGTESMFWKTGYTFRLSSLDTSPVLPLRQHEMPGTLPSQLPD